MPTVKTIKFRVLRKVKNKIVVASYPQWYRLMTTNYNKFNLIVDQEYHTFDKGGFVYNHKGEQLFFYTYDPREVPVYQWNRYLDTDGWYEHGNRFAIQYDPLGSPSYHMPGADCQGTPTFSHMTADHIVNNNRQLEKMNDFEPLTVGTVVRWFGWIFLDRLNNMQFIV
jgi:hypothetical protein